MRPKTRLSELESRWTPIFADAGRDFQHLAEVRSFRRTPSGARLRAATSEGEACDVLLSFVTPHVLRVQLVVSERPPRRTPMLDGTPPTAPAAVTADGEAIHVSSGALTASVRRRPWRLSVAAAGARPFYRQEIHDRALMGFLSMPMGYSRGRDGDLWCHETFTLSTDESLFGLGQHYGSPDRRGQRLISWSRDSDGLNTGPVTYNNIPFFMSSAGYGIFVNHASPIVYELGYPSTSVATFQVEDPYLDYFLIYGPGAKDVLARYHELTGRPPVPPLWSFGVWMSRCMYSDRPQVEGVVERLHELAIPLDVVHLDPLWLKHRRAHVRDGCDFVWDDEAYPDPPGFVRWLGERGVKLSLWENPYVWRDTEMFREGMRRGFIVTMPDGAPAPSQENPDEASPVDFSNPAAARWWQRKHVPYLKMGVASFKSDYGEGLPGDADLTDGQSGRQAHNLYPLLYNRAVFEVIQRHRGEGEAVVFGRSGYAGSQRYPINWTGDAQCTWEGMAGALRAGLGLSLSGIPFWSHDIGGFWNPDAFKPPDPTLYIRWAQFGLLSSHARFHGVRGREPWYYGDRAVEIVREFARLRYRLLPYLFALAHQAHETGVPVVRPLWLEYPDDPATPPLDKQYLLGPYLLVAPAFNEEGRCRPYLPAGRWYDWWEGSSVDGPKFLDLTVPLERIPFYVREDSILPLAPVMDHVNQRPWQPIELQVRVSNEASFTLWTPDAPVGLRARRQRRTVRLEIDGPPAGRKGPAQAYEVRFLPPAGRQGSPAGLRDVRFEGAARDASWDGDIARLTARGRCAVVGEV